MDVSAQYKNGKFTITSMGVDVEFTYDDMREYVREAHRRDREMKWVDFLRYIARAVAKVVVDFYKGEADLYIVTDVVMTCLMALFRRFLDMLVAKVTSVVSYLYRRGLELILRFINWLFGKNFA